MKKFRKSLFPFIAVILFINICYSQNLLPARSNNHWGFINIYGQWNIPPDFNKVNNFKNCAAAIKSKNNLWGFIDTNGNIMIPCIYEYVSDFNNYGKAIAVSSHKNQTYIIDKTGKKLFCINRKIIGTVFHDSHFFIANSWVITDKGNLFNLHYAENSETPSMYCVSDSSILIIDKDYEKAKFVLYDYSGNVKGKGIEYKSKILREDDFLCNFPQFVMGNIYRAKKIEGIFKWGLVDSNNNILIDYKFKSVTFLNNKISCGITDSGEVFINRELLLISPYYDWIADGNFLSIRRLVKTRNQFHIINVSENFLDEYAFNKDILENLTSGKKEFEETVFFQGYCIFSDCIGFVIKNKITYYKFTGEKIWQEE